MGQELDREACLKLDQRLVRLLVAQQVAESEKRAAVRSEHRVGGDLTLCNVETVLPGVTEALDFRFTADRAGSPRFILHDEVHGLGDRRRVVGGIPVRYGADLEPKILEHHEDECAIGERGVE